MNNHEFIGHHTVATPGRPCPTGRRWLRFERPQHGTGHATNPGDLLASARDCVAKRGLQDTGFIGIQQGFIGIYRIYQENIGFKTLNTQDLQDLQGFIKKMLQFILKLILYCVANLREMYWIYRIFLQDYFSGKLLQGLFGGLQGCNGCYIGILLVIL